MNCERLRWFLLTVLAFVVGMNAEVVVDSEVERFCYPEQHKNSRRSCECSRVNAPPWGIRSINIDCSYKQLKFGDFSEVLPLYVSALDASWNSMDALPTFASDSLQVMNFMHNNITTIAGHNFVKVTNVRELYLSWNSIQSIELNAFDELTHLRVLDLSHNNLHALALQLFRPLLALDVLNLSWNRQLNQTEGLQQSDFYRAFGVNIQLRTLGLQACNLADVLLPENVPLVELDLRHNLLETVPTKLPTALEKLDISENLFRAFSPTMAAKLSAKLKELYLEDMPHFKSVEDDAFLPLLALNKLSFRNSRQLILFSGAAFGAGISRFPALHSINFRGTSIAALNASLEPVFQQLTELDLNGTPLVCDCDLVWIKALRLETNGRCFKPSRLRGQRLTDANESDFSCAHWPQWVGGLLIFGLILLCSAGIYAIVMCLRPNRGGVTLRRKVGIGSPYARVTIEPNRRENYY